MIAAMDDIPNLNIGILPCPPFNKRYILSKIYPDVNYRNDNIMWKQLISSVKVKSSNIIIPYIGLLIEMGKELQLVLDAISTSPNRFIHTEQVDKFVDFKNLLISREYMCDSVKELKRKLKNKVESVNELLHCLYYECLMYVDAAFKAVTSGAIKKKEMPYVKIL
jgi:hypothetical protein